METWKKYLQFFSDNPYLTLGAVAVGLLLVIILLVKMVRRNPKVIKAFSDSAGTVYVSTHAIIDLVRATCEHVEGVSRPRVRLKEKRGVTHLNLHLRLESGSRIREIREAIRKHLKMTLQDNLGIERLGNITVVVSEYKPGPLDAIAVREDTERDDAPPAEFGDEDANKSRPVSAAELLAEKEQASNDDDHPSEDESSEAARK